MAERSRRQSAAARDIRELPPVADPARRRACRYNLREFATTYLPAAFDKPLSGDHERILATLQETILHGGRHVLAAPRGFGKTTLTMTAALWAYCYAHRRFVAVVAGNSARARELMRVILVPELLQNDRLADDFPELVFPLLALDNVPQRAGYQTYRGRHTNLKISDRLLVAPTIPGARTSGARVAAAGLSSAGIRGLLSRLPDGSYLRPDLALVDDPQTDASAKSNAQTNDRESLIDGALLGLAGPGQTLAAVMTCTVIRPDDLAARYLDPNNHLTWTKHHGRLVYSWPKDAEKWERYRELRDSAMRAGHPITKANNYFRRHKRAMLAGAKIAWDHYGPEDLHPVQYAFHLLWDDPAAFWAERQNEPQAADTNTLDVAPLVASEIASRTNRVKRGTVPLEAEYLTIGVDCHDDAHYYVVLASTPAATAYVVDYGMWPRQKRNPAYKLRQAEPAIPKLYRGATKSERLARSLADLLDTLAKAAWVRESGEAIRPTLALIDSGYLPSAVTGIVDSTRALPCMAARGKSIGPRNKPIEEYNVKAGERLGPGWALLRRSKQSPRRVTVDTNAWKSRVRDALQTPPGNAGAITLYGSQSRVHQAFGAQCCVEHPTPTTVAGRTVEVWEVRRPGDNHLFDSLILAAVAASVAGARNEQDNAATPKRRRARYL